MSAKQTNPPHNLGHRGLRLVVAALILRPRTGDDSAAAGDPQSEMEVLICQRMPDQAMALKWEFPGGKIEPGETAEEALHRELDEELGIDAAIGPRVAQIRHNYRNGGAVDLQFFTVKDFSGELENRIFNEIRWSALPALPTYDFLAADRDLVRDLADGKLL